MKKITLFLLLLLPLYRAQAFCGFYVAGAGAEIFNQASQVILVRDGLKTVLTMQNDFKGDVTQFAMVVPVPTVLQRDQIRIADPNIFAYLDQYSSPRLAEYYDENPCYDRYRYYESSKSTVATPSSAGAASDDYQKKDYKVTIEAQYSVGEYDILILSAKESGGLESWLKDNGYHIPEGAQRVLRPYIENKLKFFVVKVNLEKQQKQGFTALRPLQISYEHERFMLPIRLGMANATDYQDLIVYAFTRTGRVECSNYRTSMIPTNKDVPLRVKDNFGPFYKAVFDKAWRTEGRTAVMLEYAWDLGSQNYVKCDPCATTPPMYSQLKEAGIPWVLQRGGNAGWGASDYEGELFFTRLHVRYNEEHFPEDLVFVATPNKESFQGRYVLHHPATGEMNCDAGREYQRKLRLRNEQEEVNLTALTGWSKDGRKYYDDSDDDNIGGGSLPRWPIWPAAVALLAVLLAVPHLLQRLQNRLTA